jgi:uncharacterized protein (DUF1697 family)
LARKSPAPRRYIAFLRAINVGGHTVKMDRLRALFEEMGFADVETFIASGNVIFRAPEDDAAALEAKIERHLKAALGYEVATFVRTPAEVAETARHQPFPGEPEGSVLMVDFLRAAPAKEAREKVMALRTETDDFDVRGRELFWLVRADKMSTSKLSGATFEKALGMPATMRNITTVKKLAAKYPD